MSKRYSSFDFDRNFDKNFNRLAKGAIIAWVTWALICLAFVVGVVYIAIHFIAKYW